MVAFGPEQARWFYGRDRLLAQVIQHLDERVRVGGPLVVVAPSGAGKSSLLWAGLLPKLADGALPGSRHWPCLQFSPTNYPMRVFITYVAAVTGLPHEEVAEVVARGPQACAAMLRAALHAGGGGDVRLVLVVDQLEELFTLCEDERERREFIELICTLAEPGPGGQAPVALVVYGLRADFYAPCADYPQLRAALQDGQVFVGPMSADQLREVIVFPAQAVGLEIEDGLVELLLRDLGDSATTGNATSGEAADGGGPGGYEAGRLPLLAHALRAAWQQRHGTQLTVAGYQATGGIHHAVATTAERVFTGLDQAGQRATRALFLRLVKIGDGVEDTRQRVDRTTLLKESPDPAATAAALDAFTQSRLLTQHQDSIEITHEALLRAWPRLREWIDSDRAGNLTRQQLEEAATAWDHNHHNPADLYRGNRLHAAQAWATTTLHKDDLSPAASAFLTASTHHAHRATILRRTVAVALTFLAVIATGTAIVAFQTSSTARTERDQAIFNQIIEEADQLRTTNASLAAQLDLTAYRMVTDHRIKPKNQDLYAHLITDANTLLSATPINDHTQAVAVMAFGPNGRTLATSDDQGVRLWNVSDPAHPTQLSHPFARHGDTVVNVVVAFSHDGRTLATSDDQGVRLWNVSDPAHPTQLSQSLTSHGDSVENAVAFSPDGRILATTTSSDGANGTVGLWNVSDPARPTQLSQSLTSHGDTVENAVVFSPGGRTLATSDDQGVRLWNVSDPAHPTQRSHLSGGSTGTGTVAFSPDGRTLGVATTNGDKFGTVRLWNVSDPAHPTQLSHLFGGNQVTYMPKMAFSPDGRTLATTTSNPNGSSDDIVGLWNVSNPRHPTQPGHSLTGQTVAFSPNSRTLAIANGPTVRLWNMPAVLYGNGSVNTMAFSPDGRTLATTTSSNLPGGADDTVLLWNVSDPAHPRTRLGQPDTDTVVSSSDGRTLATSDDQGVRLWRWNVSDPAHSTQLSNLSDAPAPPTGAVAFSSDGRTLATGSAGNTFMQLWNVSNPRHPTRIGQSLTGHTKVTDAVAFSHDGRTLATGSNDSTVSLWNVSDPAHPTQIGQSLTGHTQAVDAVAFSSDDRTLATGSNDGTVRLWALNINNVTEYICATTTLTRATWRQYIPETQYTPPCP